MQKFELSGVTAFSKKDDPDLFKDYTGLSLMMCALDKPRHVARVMKQIDNLPTGTKFTISITIEEKHA